MLSRRTEKSVGIQDRRLSVTLNEKGVITELNVANRDTCWFASGERLRVTIRARDKNRDEITDWILSDSLYLLFEVCFQFQGMYVTMAGRAAPKVAVRLALTVSRTPE